MKYTFAVSDYDHTLSNESKQVSEHNQRAIRNFQEAGGKFMLCSGRMLASARMVAKSIGIKGEIIAYNGAVIGDIESGEISYQCLLKKEVALNLVQGLERESGVEIRLFINDVIYGEKENPKFRAYTDANNFSYCITGEPLSEYLSKKEEDVALIRAVADEEKVLELYEKYRAINSPEYNVVVSEAHFLEFISPDAGKGTALQYYCDKNGIDPKEVVAFGDNYNDISMIEYAGLGVAVANGVDELRQKADLVCPSNEEDGVGKTLEKIINGENLIQKSAN